MLLDDVAKLVHLGTRIEVACRVVWVADEDCFCALCD